MGGWLVRGQSANRRLPAPDRHLQCRHYNPTAPSPTLCLPSATLTPSLPLLLPSLPADSGIANKLIDAAVAQYVLPLMPALFADEDPMPL